jgi:hypothetical protein
VNVKLLVPSDTRLPWMLIVAIPPPLTVPNSKLSSNERETQAIFLK